MLQQRCYCVQRREAVRSLQQRQRGLARRCCRYCLRQWYRFQALLEQQGRSSTLQELKGLDATHQATLYDIDASALTLNIYSTVNLSTTFAYRGRIGLGPRIGEHFSTLISREQTQLAFLAALGHCIQERKGSHPVHNDILTAICPTMKQDFHNILDFDRVTACDNYQ
jgi:hypothetical protein